MKKLLYLLCFILIIGCETFQSNDLCLIGNKTGYLVMSNEDLIFFKCASINITNDKIKVESDKIKQTTSWRNVRKVVIYNDCLQQDYIDELRRIKQHMDEKVKK